jgi:hypothetical protein
MFALKVPKVCDEGGNFQRYIISPDEWVKCFREGCFNSDVSPRML